MKADLEEQSSIAISPSCARQIILPEQFRYAAKTLFLAAADIAKFWTKVWDFV